MVTDFICFSSKTPHWNKLETKLKKRDPSVRFHSPFCCYFKKLRYKALFHHSTDLNNETGEKSLFPRTRKGLFSFSLARARKGDGWGKRGGGIEGGKRWN